MATQTQCPLLPIHRAIFPAIESDVMHSFHGHNRHHHNNKHHNNNNETSMEYSCNSVNLLAKANPESLLILLDDEKNFGTGHALHYEHTLVTITCSSSSLAPSLVRREHNHIL
jgi:hypothetical protein